VTSKVSASRIFNAGKQLGTVDVDTLGAVGQPNYAGGYHSVRYYKIGKGTASQEATFGAEFDTTRGHPWAIAGSSLDSASVYTAPGREDEELIDIDIKYEVWRNMVRRTGPDGRFVMTKTPS
jgi:hypothetical protein